MQGAGIGTGTKTRATTTLAARPSFRSSEPTGASAGVAYRAALGTRTPRMRGTREVRRKPRRATIPRVRGTADWQQRGRYAKCRGTLRAGCSPVVRIAQCRYPIHACGVAIPRHRLRLPEQGHDCRRTESVSLGPRAQLHAASWALVTIALPRVAQRVFLRAPLATLLPELAAMRGCFWRKAPAPRGAVSSLNEAVATTLANLAAFYHSGKSLAAESRASFPLEGQCGSPPFVPEREE